LQQPQQQQYLTSPNGLGGRPVSGAGFPLPQLSPQQQPQPTTGQPQPFYPPQPTQPQQLPLQPSSNKNALDSLDWKSFQ
jgi:hypothetical protein